MGGRDDERAREQEVLEGVEWMIRAISRSKVGDVAGGGFVGIVSFLHFIHWTTGSQ